MKNRTHSQPPQGLLRRELRTHATGAEATLWLMLKSRQVEGVKFRRQFSIGPYVLDFYSPEIGLCIELDGQHHTTYQGNESDYIRTKYLLREHNIRTLRFENKLVFSHPEGVLSEIRDVITEIRTTQLQKE